jgi:N-methylhydantoinase A
VLTVNGALEALDMTRLEEQFQALEREARRIIGETGIDPDTASAVRLADLRYQGQGFELVVELPPGPYADGSAAAILARFEQDYRAVYGRIPRGGAAEVVNIRVSMQAGAAVPALKVSETAAQEADERRARPIYFGEADGFVEAAIYDRRTLCPAAVIHGPAAIEEPGSTLLLPPAASARVEPDGNIVVTLG